MRSQRSTTRRACGRTTRSARSGLAGSGQRRPRCYRAARHTSAPAGVAPSLVPQPDSHAREKEHIVATLLQRLATLACVAGERPPRRLAADRSRHARLLRGLRLIAQQRLHDSRFIVPRTRSRAAEETAADRGRYKRADRVRVTGGTTISDAKYHAAVEAALDQAKLAPQVAAVVDPFVSKAISRDGRSALAGIRYTVTRARTSIPTVSPHWSPATQVAQRAGLVRPRRRECLRLRLVEARPLNCPRLPESRSSSC